MAGIWDLIAKGGSAALDFMKSDGGRNAAGIAGALLGASSLGYSKQQPVGYQGGIPQYTATREKVPGTNPTTRRPGSGGQRYFTDTQFTKNGLMPGYATPEQLAAQNAANQKAKDDQLAAILAAIKGGQTPAPAGGTPQQTTPPPKPHVPGEVLIPAKKMDVDERAWSKQNPIGGSLASDLDSLDELKAYAANAMKGSGGDGSDRAVNSGEASQILKASSALGQSPKQIAEMLGVTENEVVNRIRGEYPHLGYNYAEKYGYAEGGIAGVPAGRYLKGSTDGMADEVPASIDGKDPAALSHGEFVIPSRIVSAIGSGNSEAGARALYAMVERIKKNVYGGKEQKPMNPKDVLPA